MEEAVVLELPYPPSENHYRAHVRGHMVVITAAGKAFRKAVRAVAVESGFVPDSTGATPRTLRGPLSVRVELYPADNRRRDIDNPLKALLDSLTFAGVWEDDSQIVRLLVEKKRRVDGNPFCVVAIREHHDLL